MILFNESEVKIKVNGSEYNISKKATANVVDSFVTPSNKVGTGSGEARLYVSPQGKNDTAIFNFDSSKFISKGKKKYHPCHNKCFFSKDNLLSYLDNVKLDYQFPKANYRDNISTLYEDRLSRVEDLEDETYFTIYNQNGDLDSARFYIGSVDEIWELFREISLPNITTLTINKLENNTGEILFYFELSLNTIQRASMNSEKTIEEKTIEAIKNDTNITETEKETLIRARNGQGKFRSNTLSIMPMCPFTGIKNHALLRASHIMPWSKCENNKQRLNGFNGLTLTPTYDVLFDIGIISFEDDGTLLISSRLEKSDIDTLGLTFRKCYDIRNDSGKKSEYLKFHRENVFKN